MVNEDEIRIAFREEFSYEYLELLDSESTAKNSLVELLYMGFARGYMRANEECLYEVRYLEETKDDYNMQLCTPDYGEAVAEMKDILECSNVEAVKIVRVKTEEIHKIVEVDSDYV